MILKQLKDICVVPFFSLRQDGVRDFRNAQCSISYARTSRKVNIRTRQTQAEYDLDRLCLAALAGTMDMDTYEARFFMCAYPHINKHRGIDAVSILLLSPVQHAELVNILDSQT